jgi:hypothetical protein
MTHLRAEWTTHANLKDYFDVSMKALVDSVNRIALVNPEWDAATTEEQDQGAVDRTLMRLPGCMGTLDEMPLTLNVSTGQKPHSDKKFGGHLADIADLAMEAGMMAEWAVQLREEPMLLRLFAPLLGPHRNAAKELKSGKMEGTQRRFNGAPGPPMQHLPTFAGSAGRLPEGHSHGQLFVKNTTPKHSHIKVYYAAPCPYFPGNCQPNPPNTGLWCPGAAIIRALHSSNIFVGPSFGPTGPTFLTRCGKSTYFLANRVRKILN